MKNPYHNPPHIYLDDTIYFITARTIEKNNYFSSDKKKEILKNKLSETVHELKIIIYAWVILGNHYHLLIKINKNKNLSKLIQLFHGRTSYILNKIDNKKGRQVWFNYWDYCIRNDEDFNNHLDYINFNPVKHGLVNKPGDYKYSSYGQYLKKGYYEAEETKVSNPVANERLKSLIHGD